MSQYPLSDAKGKKDLYPHTERQETADYIQYRNWDLSLEGSDGANLGVLYMEQPGGEDNPLPNPERSGVPDSMEWRAPQEGYGKPSRAETGVDSSLSKQDEKF